MNIDLLLSKADIPQKVSSMIIPTDGFGDEHSLNWVYCYLKIGVM